MLLLARSLKELRFGSLMEIYIEGNREHGQDAWPDEPEMRQIQLSEQDFYRYLREAFFRTTGAVYAVWEAGGQYVSALRLEPYRDGLLMEALETAPEQRRRGYAAELIQAVQETLKQQGAVKIYSHVHKQNTASLKTHEKCGFRPIADYAACADGSVSRKMYTMCYEG
ncbi:MAG: GNAT family N-acetyltransferase [Faecousia sp.]